MSTRSSHARHARRSTLLARRYLERYVELYVRALLGLRLGTVRAALARCPTLSGRRILVDHGPVELRHRALGQALPDLIHAQQRNAEVAAHGQRLAVRAQRHDGVVDLAIARIENVAVFIFQAVPPHATHKRQPKQRGVLAVTHAMGTSWIGLVTGSRKQLGDRPFKNAAAAFDKQ